MPLPLKTIKAQAMAALNDFGKLLPIFPPGEKAQILHSPGST
jgi:hypothetical protein